LVGGGSLWLPETACNDQTLGLLIDRGMRFVILAPDQAGRVRSQTRKRGAVRGLGSIDTTRPYRYFPPRRVGRSLANFLLSWATCPAIASNGRVFKRGLVEDCASARTGSLVNVATDGETYGHHFTSSATMFGPGWKSKPGSWPARYNYAQYLDEYRRRLSGNR